LVGALKAKSKILAHGKHREDLTISGT